MASKLLDLGKQENSLLGICVKRHREAKVSLFASLLKMILKIKKSKKKKALQISVQFCHLGDDLLTSGMGSEHR